MRKILGLTQKDLAKVLGCSLGAVEAYEQAKRKPSEVFEERLDRLNKRAKREEAKLDTGVTKE
jgi:transcriptional regulator with XRE-family HTH domain